MNHHVSDIYPSLVKRALDVGAGVALLILTAPVQAAIATAVVIDDGFPVYFHQPRAGRKGKTFRLHKFRTMKIGTEERAGSFPTEDMVTSVGSVLRRFSLDEIPQLLNIIAGEMSFVGPRPPLVSHVDRYTDVQLGRLDVRPGLTGLAQVTFRNNAPWSRRIELDLHYISRLSMRLDALIVFKTAVSVLTGRDQVVGQTAADVDDLRPAEALSGSPAGGAA